MYRPSSDNPAFYKVRILEKKEKIDEGIQLPPALSTRTNDRLLKINK
jgi:hypothetical protein